MVCQTAKYYAAVQNNEDASYSGKSPGYAVTGGKKITEQKSMSRMLPFGVRKREADIDLITLNICINKHRKPIPGTKGVAHRSGTGNRM